MLLPDIFNNENSQQIDFLVAMWVDCSGLGWKNVTFPTDLFILITGLVANAALLWLFFKERRVLSAPQVLGVNLVLMDLLYLVMMPVELLYDETMDSVNRTTHSVSNGATNGVRITKDIFSMFVLVGCPLLLACMCVERYMAVIRPVLYLRLRRWEYRVIVSGTAWTLTLSFCLAMGLTRDRVSMMVPVSIILSCLFLVMLASLGGVIQSLWQRSPALASTGNQAHCVTPLKRRAVGNVLAVVVPSVVSYLPVLVMFPVVLYEYYWDNSMNDRMCTLFEFSNLFPKFGLLIGPMFYLSKARRMNFLCRKEEKIVE